MLGAPLKGDSVEGNTSEDYLQGLKQREPTATMPRRRSGASSAADADFETVEVTMPGPERATFDPISDIAGRLTLGGLGVASM
ncbi:MAG: hypothetical protein R3C56_18765 [Pirellulaceae bacterium]